MSEGGVSTHAGPQRKKILLVDDCTTSLLVEELILLDLVMPDVDGLEVLRALRSEEQTRSIPVFLVSVRSDLESEALHNGVTDYLTKPVDAAVLKRKVRERLGR